MITLGVVGGIGPESTIAYYRQIIAAYRKRTADGSYPSILLNSIDLARLLGLMEAQQYADVTRLLLEALTSLESAGAAVAIVAANTPHIVFDDLRAQSPIELISIVEAAAAAARRSGLRRLALLGTRFTMQGRFYPDVFSRSGLEIVTPTDDEQRDIHALYFGELVPGVFRDETRERVLGVVARMKVEDGLDGVILGGTELPLLLPDARYLDLTFLDTTAIHVEAAVDRMLETNAR